MNDGIQFKAPLFAALNFTRGVGRLAREFGPPLDRYRDAARQITETPGLGRGLSRVFGTIDETLDEMKGHWTRSALYAQSVLARHLILRRHPQWLTLIEIITSPTAEDRDGYPQITKSSFDKFVLNIHHLFRKGNDLLEWLETAKGILKEESALSEEMKASIARAVEVLKNCVLTPANTAPTDLWELRQVLSTFKKLGVLQFLNEGRTLHVSSYAKANGLDASQLLYDLRFLYHRRYLDLTNGFVRTSSDAARVLEEAEALPEEFLVDWTTELTNWFLGKTEKEQTLKRWFRESFSTTPVKGWVANYHEIELGYCLLPLVLALHAAGCLKKMGKIEVGQRFEAPHLLLEMKSVLESAGLIRAQRVTELGKRVFSRGSGIFGIIGAYQPVRNRREETLRSLLDVAGEAPPRVRRGPNVGASALANLKTFEPAVNNLSRYCEATGFVPKVVIEHALGKGVGLQQFWKHPELGQKIALQYFGADFETEALDAARREQAEGRLPPGMRFIQADIGDPATLIASLPVNKRGEVEGAFMIVGNGFHEIRDKTDAETVEIFKGYRRAKINLIVIEESRLSDRMIRESAFHTYQAAFVLEHDSSGQVLRAPFRYDEPMQRLSLSELLTLAEYEILEQYGHSSRPVFPCFDLAPHQNPPISKTFFCVPGQ